MHVILFDIVYVTGHWLQKVLWDMKGKANGTLNDAKLFLYSAVSWYFRSYSTFI